MYFLNENAGILFTISLKFVPEGPIHNIPALVQIMAWRRPGDKPLFEPMMVNLLTHICVTWPQKLNCNWNPHCYDPRGLSRHIFFTFIIIMHTLIQCGRISHAHIWYVMFCDGMWWHFGEICHLLVNCISNHDYWEIQGKFIFICWYSLIIYWFSLDDDDGDDNQATEP